MNNGHVRGNSSTDTQSHTTITVLNIMVKWLTPLLHIWEVPGSNLGTEISYPEFSMVFLGPSRESRDSTLK
jgi:hypothetical protein